MIKEPIAILGGGNIGHCMAADLTLAGYAINLYEHPNFEAAFRNTLETKEIELISAGPRTGRAEIHKVTMDIKEAVEDARLVFLVIPSFGQELFFKTLTPHLGDGHIVMLFSGNYGSLRLKAILNENRPNNKVTIYETNSMPYGVRLLGPSTVKTVFATGPGFDTKAVPPKVPHLPHVFCTSALPARDTDIAFDDIKELFPRLIRAKNVIVSALRNPNPSVHPVGALLNIGRIEYSRGQFYLYLEGCTPSVRRVVHGISLEMQTVAKVFDPEVTPPYNEPFEVMFFPLVGSEGRNRDILGPTSRNDRYITEDVPYGLVPVSELGKKLGIQTPITDGIIAIATAVEETDYRTVGRTLGSLGIADLTKEEIVNLVEG